jgi:hypothetical protein
MSSSLIITQNGEKNTALLSNPKNMEPPEKQSLVTAAYFFTEKLQPPELRGIMSSPLLLYCNIADLLNYQLNFRH